MNPRFVLDCDTILREIQPMPSIQLALEYGRLATGLDHHSAFRCPDCLGVLTLHQPDVESPDRLLGVCPDCRSWFLVEAFYELMVWLPDQDALRQILHAPPPGSL
jgi:hypothetical protein